MFSFEFSERVTFLVPTDICIKNIKLDFSKVGTRHSVIVFGSRFLVVLFVHRREIELDLMACAQVMFKVNNNKAKIL